MMTEPHEAVSPVDSLDGEDTAEFNGVIKVANQSLLSQLTTSSPLSVYKPPITYRTTNDYTEELQKDHSDYQFVNSDIDDDLTPSHSRTGTPQQIVPTLNNVVGAPTHSRSPQMAQPIKTGADIPASVEKLSVDKYVPPLQLTDSLICDDPDPSAAKVVTDSLDFSLNEDDFQRLQNLMGSEESLPNPFNVQPPTPNTKNELSISLALVQSATPRPIYSQSDFLTSVMSSYAENDVPTPRASVQNIQQQQSVSQPHMAQQHIPQQHLLQQHIQIQQQHVPLQHVPQQHIPQQHLPQQHLPQQHVPQQQLSQQHITKQQGPQQHAPQQHVPQQHVPQQHVPQQCVPQQHVPQQHVPQQHVPQQHMFTQPITQEVVQQYHMLHQHQDKLGQQTPQQHTPQQHISQQQPSAVVQQLQQIHPHQDISNGMTDSHRFDQNYSDQMLPYNQQHQIQQLKHTQPQYYQQTHPSEQLYHNSRDYDTQTGGQPINQPHHYQSHQPPQQLPQNSYQEVNTLQNHYLSQEPQQWKQHKQLQPSQYQSEQQAVDNTSARSSGVKLSPRRDTTTGAQTKIVGTVAPKPDRPNKDFIERNINRARGVTSAKNGYASRRTQAKQQHADLKEWAPGMVIPRKKAASADNATRSMKPLSPVLLDESAENDHNSQLSVKSVWENRSSQLSQAKKLPTAASAPVSNRGNQRLTTGRDSITESRVKFDVKLDVADKIVQGEPHSLRLIGPIPQQYKGNMGQSPRSYAPLRTDAIYGPEPHSGPIPRYQQPTGPVHGSLAKSQNLASASSRAADIEPAYTSYYDNYYESVNDGQQALEENVASAPHVYSAVNESYSQHYNNNNMQSIPYRPHPGHSQSRWNPPQKPPNFVPDDSDFSLNDVIAMEEQKLSCRSSQSSSSALNPYQTVPPIQQQHLQKQSSVDDSSTDVDDTSSYSHIHKTQKERENGVSYKKYTLKDYKQLNKEVKLGGLGPSADPCVLKEKHELRQKQLQLAKEAREQEAKRASAKLNSSDTKKDQKQAQPSGRQLAQEYAKNVPKPKVVPKSKNPTPAPPVGSLSSRSLSKLNDLPNDGQQLTYRANHHTPSAQLTNLGAVPTHLANHIIPSTHVTNQIADRQGQTTSFIQHSYSSPALSGQLQSEEDSTNQFSYLDTIEALHKRHLEEKRLVADLRQKI